MQFSAKLKLEHLQEIIELQQSMEINENEEKETPLQFAWIDENNLAQKREKTGVKYQCNDDFLNLEPLTLCLFPEIIEHEDETLDQF